MASGSKMISPKSSKQVEAEEEVADGRFEIGDDSDLENDEELSLDNLREPPPPYEISGDDSNSHGPPAQEPRHGESGVLREEISSPEEPQAEESRTAREHVVRKGDTVRSLALKYNLDPYDLITLNKLPHSAMHMSPNLLQTRKSVLLSQPRADRGQQGGNEQDDEQRTRERQVKRFQILTKTPDPGIAKAYLAVQNLDDSISLSEPSSVLFEAFDGDYENSVQADNKPVNSQEKFKQKGKVTIEGRAVDRYYSDEEWAARVAREDRDEAERKRRGGALSGLKGILGGKADKGKASAVRKGNYIQGAPWIESR